MSEDVITSQEAAPLKVPKGFRDLNKAELEAACDSFGSDKGTIAQMLINLEEDGVTFEQYKKAFGLTVEEPVAEDDFPPPPVDIEQWPDDEGVEEVNDIKTATPQPELVAADKYLVKFVGENPYFEFGKYKFTQEKPYGIMPASDAQKALVEEPTKFRQAFPNELSEFYG